VNKREWLASQGLAEIGKRGRFSKAANDAWESYLSNSVDAWVEPAEPVNPDSGYEDVELPFDGPEVDYIPEAPREAVRKETLAYTIDNGVMIGHIHCGRCENLIQYCACADGPGKVRWVTEEQTPYLVEA
jgi:hypothetical protein